MLHACPRNGQTHRGAEIDKILSNDLVQNKVQYKYRLLVSQQTNATTKWKFRRWLTGLRSQCTRSVGAFRKWARWRRTEGWSDKREPGPPSKRPGHLLPEISSSQRPSHRCRSFARSAPRPEEVTGSIRERKSERDVICEAVQYTGKVHAKNWMHNEFVRCWKTKESFGAKNSYGIPRTLLVGVMCNLTYKFISRYPSLILNNISQYYKIFNLR